MQDSKRDTDIKNRLLDSVGEDKGGMILPYVKQMTSASPMHEAEHSKLVHWDNPEGWNGEGSGRWQGGLGWGTHVYPWLIHVAKTTTMLQSN